MSVSLGVHLEKQVLLFSESSEPGGAETVVLGLAAGLPGSTWRTHVLLMQEGWLHDAVSERGIMPELLPSTRSFDVSFLNRLVKTLRRLRIDIVHSHLPTSNAYACLAGRLARVPVVATYHGRTDVFGPSSRTDRAKRWIVRRLAQKIVAVSADMRDDLITNAAFPRSKIDVVYNGIDWGAFDTLVDVKAKRAELDIPESAKIVGMVGVVRQVKGHSVVLRALVQIKRRYPDVYLVVIGHEHESYKRELIEEAKSLAVHDRLRFLGFRPDVAQLYRIMDVYIMPSWSEGHPLATIEAMGAKVPVVVSNVGGHPEIVQDMVTGYIVPPGHDEVLAQRVMEVLADPEAASGMAERARSFVRERYSLARMLADYEALYRSILK